MNILLSAAIIPVVLLLMFIYKKDTKREPMNVVMKIFFLGVGSCVPTIICELMLDPVFSTDNYSGYIELFINIFVGVALIEEFFKWLIIKSRIYNHESHDETYDSIVYAVFASLGFATLENILYVFGGGLVTALLRAITSIPGHACFAVVMGYFFSKAKIASETSKHKENQYLILGLLLPTLIHTIYDFLIFTQETNFIIMWVVYIIALFIFCFILVSKAAKKNLAFRKEILVEPPTFVAGNPTINVNQNTQPTFVTQTNSNIKFCTKCGKRIDNAIFCPFCGEKSNN